MDLGVAAHEFRLDTSLSQIGAHGEVGDGSDHCDRSGDVVEHSVGTRLGVGDTHKGEGRYEHHGADGLEEVSHYAQECGERYVRSTSLSHGL